LFNLCAGRTQAQKDFRDILTAVLAGGRDPVKARTGELVATIQAGWEERTGDESNAHSPFANGTSRCPSMHENIRRREVAPLSKATEQVRGGKRNEMFSSVQNNPKSRHVDDMVVMVVMAMVMVMVVMVMAVMVTMVMVMMMVVVMLVVMVMVMW
jgi:hypothetical protein